MNRLVLVTSALLAACGAGGTSLDGTVECGPMTCGAGELCMRYYAGIDAAGDSGPGLSCVRVPDSCEVSDCARGECAPCVVDLCGCTECTSVTERHLVCAGY
jgi:hypothetical protein